jgi:hypothetical protein
MRSVTRRHALLGAAALSAARTARAEDLHAITMGLASGEHGGGRAYRQGARAVREARLDAKFAIMDSSSAALTGLLSGSLRLIVSGVPELVLARARDQDVVAIANTYSGFSANLVLGTAVAWALGVAPTAPVRDRLKAMDGLLIASTSPTAIGTVAYKGAVQAAGASMRFTYMSQQAMAAALQSGAIQAIPPAHPIGRRPSLRALACYGLTARRANFRPSTRRATPPNCRRCAISPRPTRC